MPISSEDILAIVVTEAGIEPEKLRGEATLAELDIASLDLVSIAFEIEDKFGIEIATEDLKADMTLAALVEHIRSLHPA